VRLHELPSYRQSKSNALGPLGADMQKLWGQSRGSSANSGSVTNGTGTMGGAAAGGTMGSGGGMMGGR
jgi:hypothetical protein